MCEIMLVTHRFRPDQTNEDFDVAQIAAGQARSSLA